jgi:hypothetical protein
MSKKYKYNPPASSFIHPLDSLTLAIKNVESKTEKTPEDYYEIALAGYRCYKFGVGQTKQSVLEAIQKGLEK